MARKKAPLATAGPKAPAGAVPPTFAQVQNPDPAAHRIEIAATRCKVLRVKVKRADDINSETEGLLRSRVVFVPTSSTFSLRHGRVYERSGVVLDEEHAWGRLPSGTAIVVTGDGKPVHAAYRRLLKPSALLLVAPLPGQPESVPVPEPPATPRAVYAGLPTRSSGGARPLPKGPPPPAPLFVTVTDVQTDGGLVVCSRTEVRIVPIAVAATQVPQGEPDESQQTEDKPIFVVHKHRLSLNAVRIYNAAGKRLPPDEVRKRLEPGQVVLLSIDGRKPHHLWRDALRKDALIFVPALDAK